GPKGEQRQDASGGALIDQQGEQFQGRRIDPVQILHDKEHGLLCCDAQENRQERLVGLLLLLRRRHRQGGIVSPQRQGEEGGEEGDGLCQWQAILHQKSFKFAELLLRGLLPRKAQGDPLQQVDQRIQRRILVVRRTLTRRQPCLGLGGDVFLQ